MNIKTGIGYDIHRLAEGRKLYLGGIEIPHSKGLLGHSDGDCLIHAIIDALLGARGKGDIGYYFPDANPAFKDIRSIKMLEPVSQWIKEEKVKIWNIDTIVIAEEPKLEEYIPRMKEVICPVLELDTGRLGIKAKTHEGLGSIGRGEAIASWAVVLVEFCG